MEALPKAGQAVEPFNETQAWAIVAGSVAARIARPRAFFVMDGCFWRREELLN